MTSGMQISGIFARKVKPLPWPLMVIFLFLIAAIIVSGIFYYQKQKKDIFSGQISQLGAIADLKAMDIGRWLKERTGDARLIMENPFLTARLLAFTSARPNGRRPEPIRQWMASLRNNFHYQNVMLLDKSGQVVLALDEQYPALGGEGLDLIESVRRQKNVVISDLHISAAVPFPLLDICLPLTANSEIFGFVLLRIDSAQFLYPMIQSWPTPSPSAETLLVRREGDNVLYLNELRHRKNTALKLRLPLTSKETPAVMAILGKTGAVSGQDYRGIVVWAVLKPVPASNWSIVAKVDREEIEKPLRRSALTIFLITFSLILAAALLTLFLWQRQAARSRLRQLEAEAKFRQTFEFSPVGIVMVGLDKRFIRCNKAFSLGYLPEELIGKSIADMTYPADIQIGMDEMKAIARGELAISNVQKRYLHKDGRVIWGEVTISLIRDHKANPQYFMAIIQDISKRKQAEETIRQSAARLRAILDATPFPIAIVDVQDDKIDFWSRSALALFGHTAPTAAEWYKLAYPDPDYRNEVIERWKPFLEEARASSRAVNTGEYRVTCRDGSVLICELHAAFLADNLIVTFNNVTERKQAESQREIAHEALKREQFLNNVIINSIPGAFYVLDENGRYTRWNAYQRDEIIGKPEDQVAGANAADTIHPDDRELINSRIANVLGRGREETVEGRVLLRGGPAYRWLLMTGRQIMIEGKPFLVGIGIDISERKRAEIDLQNLSARNQAMLEAIPDIIMEVDTNKVYTWANHAGNKFFGAEVIGHEAAFYFEGEQQIYQQVQPIFNGKEDVVYIESWQRRRDNEKRLLAWWCRVLKDAAGNVTGALSTARDITDIKRAEDALRESERKFRETVITLDEGYYSVTLDGFLLEHNQAFNRILGFDIYEDLKGVQLPDFWQDPDRRQEYLKAFAATGSITNYQIDAKTKTGKKITILASAHLVKDVNNQPQRIEGIFLDISERIRTEAEIRSLNEELEQRVLQRTAQLEVANKELEAFSYSVSHDLRAPLRAIDGFSRIVLEEYAPKLDDEGRRLLDVIASNTHKMGQLIDDLLAFSRLSRQQMAFVPVDLAAMADDVFSELKNLEKGRKVEFKFGALPAAHGDRTMLRHVLLNLFSNALKFTRPRAKARIEFGGRAAKGETIWHVKDNGVGFDMEYAHKIFDVFQRLHGSDEFEGTGVGLAIVQRIIVRHGGHVWAESNKSGSTFYFSLPKELKAGGNKTGNSGESK
jgi:PAS domain S-box-containing protein